MTEAMLSTLPPPPSIKSISNLHSLSTLPPPNIQSEIAPIDASSFDAVLAQYEAERIGRAEECERVMSQQVFEPEMSPSETEEHRRRLEKEHRSKQLEDEQERELAFEQDIAARAKEREHSRSVGEEAEVAQLMS